MATVSETRLSYLSSPVGEGDCLALLSRLQRDLEFRSERSAPRAAAGSPQLGGSARRSRGEADGSKAWSRSCALCTIEISALRKNCIQCLSCGRWFCKSCSSWDALKQEYVCRSCAPSSNGADLNGNDGNMYIDEPACTSSLSSAKLELDRVPPVEDSVFRATEWLSLSERLPLTSNSLTRILANGNVTDDAVHDDFGSNTFDVLKDREIKKFIVQMHTVLADLERNVCDSTSPSEQHEHIVEAYQRKVATVISNLEEALHFAVDSQAVSDSRSFVSHDDVEGLVRQAAEPYVGRTTIMPEEESHTMTARSINFLKTADFLGKLVVSRAMEEMITRYDKLDENTSKAGQRDSSASESAPHSGVDAIASLDELNAVHKCSETFPSFPAFFHTSDSRELDPDLLSTEFAATFNGSSEGARHNSRDDSNWTFLSRDTFSRMAFTEATESELFLPRQHQQQQSTMFVSNGRRCSTDTVHSTASFESDFDDDVIIPDFQDASGTIVEETELTGGPMATVSAAPQPPAQALLSNASSTPQRLPPQMPTTGSSSSTSVELVDQQVPVFLKCLEDTEASEGSAVTLRCKVRANPQHLSIQWYKDGQLIRDGDPKYDLGRLGNRDYTLSFKDGVTMFDDAEYMVVARNAAGEAKSVAQLIVEPAAQQALAAEKIQLQSVTTSQAAPQQKESADSRVRVTTSTTAQHKAVRPAADGMAARPVAAVDGMAVRPAADRMARESVPPAKQATALMHLAEHAAAAAEQGCQVNKSFTERQSSRPSDVSTSASEQPLASQDDCPTNFSTDVGSNVPEEIEPVSRAPVKSLRALRRTSASTGSQKSGAKIEPPPAAATNGTGHSRRAAEAGLVDADRFVLDDGGGGKSSSNNSKKPADAPAKSVADIPDAPSAQQRSGADSVATSAAAIVQDSGCVVEVRSGLSRQLLLEASSSPCRPQQQPAVSDDFARGGNVGRSDGGSDKGTINGTSAAAALASSEQTPVLPTAAVAAATTILPTRRVVKKIIVVRRTAVP